MGAKLGPTDSFRFSARDVNHNYNLSFPIN